MSKYQCSTCGWRTDEGRAAFDEHMRTEHGIDTRKWETCHHCNGSGSQPWGDYITCDVCGGTGSIPEALPNDSDSPSAKAPDAAQSDKSSEGE